MDSADLLTVSEVANRSGFAPSAIRFYDKEGLITRQPDGRWTAAIRAKHVAAPRIHPRRP